MNTDIYFAIEFWCTTYVACFSLATFFSKNVLLEHGLLDHKEKETELMTKIRKYCSQIQQTLSANKSLVDDGRMFVSSMDSAISKMVMPQASLSEMLEAVDSRTGADLLFIDILNQVVGMSGSL